MRAVRTFTSLVFHDICQYLATDASSEPYLRKQGSAARQKSKAGITLSALGMWACCHLPGDKGSYSLDIKAAKTLGFHLITYLIKMKA